MTECVFCRIVNDPSKASVVYEDEWTLAFMDTRQANEGHLLVIPKTHMETVYDMDEETAARLFQVVPKIAHALRDSLRSDGLSIWQSNGRGAFQEVPHVHIHLMPRYVGDGLLRVYPQRVEKTGRERLDELAEEIRNQVSSSQ